MGATDVSFEQFRQPKQGGNEFGKTLTLIRHLFFRTVQQVDSRVSIDLHIRNPTEFLKGYRAVRVKVIFLLPRRLRSIFPRPLVYVEYFSKFGPIPSSTSRLHSVYQSMSSGSRKIAILPLETIHMPCHLAPNFGKLDEELWNSLDILEDCKYFYLNHYCSNWMYSWVAYWRSELKEQKRW